MKPRKLLSHRWRHVMVSTDDRCCIVIGVLKSIISQIEVRDFHKKHDIKCCLWENLLPQFVILYFLERKQ